MDCKKFSNWLENRDLYDVSEADNALKHAQACKECLAKLKFDENFDKLLYQALGKEPMPASLPGKVDLSLSRMSDKPAKTGYRLFGAFSAVVAVMVVFVFALSFSPSPSIPSVDQMGQFVIADHTHHGDSVLVVDRLEDLHRLNNTRVDPQTIMGELPRGYSFVGARVCPLGDCESVHLVFRDGERRVSLYLIRTKDVDFTLSPDRSYSMKDGNNTVQFWRQGNYVYALVG